jgi:hypothetical protein
VEGRKYRKREGGRKERMEGKSLLSCTLSGINEQSAIL